MPYVYESKISGDDIIMSRYATLTALCSFILLRYIILMPGYFKQS